MNIQAVLDQLRTAGTALGDRFYGIAEFVEANQDPQAGVVTPAAFVVAQQEQASQGAPDPGPAPQVSERFSVVLMLDASADLEGYAAAASRPALALAVRAAIEGWAPDATRSAIVYDGARLLATNRAHYFWQLDFRDTILGGSIFEWVVSLRIQLAADRTVDDVRPTWLAALPAALGGATRMADDWVRGREAIDADATKFQLRTVQYLSAEGADSNATPLVVLAACQVLKHMTAGSERAYTEGVLPGQTAALLAPGFWRVDGVTDAYLTPPTVEVQERNIVQRRP